MSSGQDENRRRRPTPYFAAHRDPLHVGEAEVENHDRWVFCGCEIDSGLSGFGFEHPQMRRRRRVVQARSQKSGIVVECVADETTNLKLVVDDQYGQRVSSHEQMMHAHGAAWVRFY